MEIHKRNPKVVAREKKPLSPEEKVKRRERLLLQGMPSITRSIADAVVTMNGEMFFLTEPDGSIPHEGSHGYGLYFRDCRYLSGYEIQIADSKLNLLISTDIEGFASVYELTNREIKVSEGEHIPMEQIGFRHDRIIDADHQVFYDWITIKNYGREKYEFPIKINFTPDFSDIFDIRGFLQEQPGQLRPPEWVDGILNYIYDGADDHYRSLAIHFSMEPEEMNDFEAKFHISLQARESKRFVLSFVIKESTDEDEIQPETRELPDLASIKQHFGKISDDWLSGLTQIDTDSLLLKNILDRSLKDLETLRVQLDGNNYFAAGVPWFVTLFGRDSIISSLQMLAYDPDIAEDTIRLLAKYQGTEFDEWRDEQPGKILHEIRMGELARLNKIPHNPYYGSVDSTPLFLILIARHAIWTGRLDLFEELKDTIESALTWVQKHSGLEERGYIEYQSLSEGGLINQGWKDSGIAILNADGSLANPPIALVEVQGYAYDAFISMAYLFEIAGDEKRGEELRQLAEDLFTRFNKDYWSNSLGFYALALQAENRQAAVVSSNPGHAMWSGIVDPQKANQVADKLMQDDMFNGWGIRTLSANENGYNPIAYHLGTVWPHDNSIIVAGLRRYGFDDAACRIFSGIVEAGLHFDTYRLPEVFSGFSRKDYQVPVHYPVACHPQAWSAGAVPSMLVELMGLQPDAFQKRLRIVRPTLPDFVDRVEVRGLKVGQARVDVNFERTNERDVVADVIHLEGDLEVTLGLGRE